MFIKGVVPSIVGTLTVTGLELPPIVITILLALTWYFAANWTEVALPTHVPSFLSSVKV